MGLMALEEDKSYTSGKSVNISTIRKVLAQLVGAFLFLLVLDTSGLIPFTALCH